MMMDRLEGVSPETKHGVMAGGAMGFYGLNELEFARPLRARRLG